MKWSRRLALTALLGVPLALFLVAKRASQERPRHLATVSVCDELAFSPDSRLLVATVDELNNPHYVFFDVQTSKCLSQRSGKDYPFQEQPLFSPNGQKIAHAEGFSWDPAPRKSSSDFLTPVFFVSGITSQKERRIGDPKIHDEDEGDEPTVESAVWTQDGRGLVVAGKRQIRRFDASNGQLLSRVSFAPLPKFTSFPDDDYEQNVVISPDGRFFLHLDSPTSLTLRETKTARVRRRIAFGTHVTSTLFGWSGNVNFVWVETQQGVAIFDAFSGRRLWIWQGLTAVAAVGGVGGTGYHLSPDEKAIVACNSSNCIARDLKDGRELWRTKSPNSSVFALSPDGTILAEARANGQILLWPLPQTS